MPRRARGDSGGGNERGRDDGGGGLLRGDVGGGDVGGNRGGKGGGRGGGCNVERDGDGGIKSVGDGSEGAKAGVVLLRQVIQKIRVDVALSRKQHCEQLLFFGAVRLREDVAQKVLLRGQLATNIQRIPL